MLPEDHMKLNNQPMVTRLSSPTHVNTIYYQYMEEIAASIAEDLIGPNVRFHHSNFKHAKISEIL